MQVFPRFTVIHTFLCFCAGLIWVISLRIRATACPHMAPPLCGKWRKILVAEKRGVVVPNPHAVPPRRSAPCVTFRLVVVSLRGPGQSPVLPFACCVGSLLSDGCCGRCSCWCRFCVRGVGVLGLCWSRQVPFVL